MTLQKNSSRSTCPHCLRPEKTCICDLVTEIDTATETLILQHPLEKNQAKGTARLLHLCLKNSQLLIGETFTPEQLHATAKQTVLLYPPTDDSICVPANELDPANTRLLVLDGTWRKTRKLLHLNPPLQQLPRLSLSQVPPTNYRIRKARGRDQLSTLEAVYCALCELEGPQTRYQALIQAFNQLIDRQIALMGQETFEKNYNV